MVFSAGSHRHMMILFMMHIISDDHYFASFTTEEVKNIGWSAQIVIILYHIFDDQHKRWSSHIVYLISSSYKRWGLGLRWDVRAPGGEGEGRDETCKSKYMKNTNTKSQNTWRIQIQSQRRVWSSNQSIKYKLKTHLRAEGVPLAIVGQCLWGQADPSELFRRGKGYLVVGSSWIGHQQS